MLCSDVEKFVHPYLDGEFAESDRVEMEQHLAECAPCRDRVSFQSSFKANLRARLRRPATPPELRGRVLGALDRADVETAAQDARRWKRRIVPAGATLAAAAVVVVFVGSTLEPSHADSPIVEDAIRSHEKNLPPEVLGSEDRVKQWMIGKVAVPVKVRVRAPGAALVGARLGHVQSRDAAQLVYNVRGSNVTVHVFDPSGMSITGKRSRRVGSREVYLDQRRGYNVVYYRDHGVGYAFTSDLDADEMLRLVSTSLSD